MQAGRLREIVEIYRSEVVATESGDVREEYTLLQRARAEVTSQNARRAMAHGEELYPTTKVFRLRMPPELRGGDRLKYRGELYECLPPSISPYGGEQTVTATLVNL